MKPLWSGTLGFGLVTFPVRLFSAVEASRTVRFRLLDRATSTPIKEIRVNPDTGKAVPWDQIVHGVERSKGQYVSLTSEDLKTIPLQSASEIALTGFVRAQEIDPRYYEQPYFLGPGKGGERAYALLRAVLEDRGRVGIGKVVLRMREHLVAVRPVARALMLHTLHYASELRDEADIPGLPRSIALRASERRMVVQLIEGMAAAFDPTRYRDEYGDALRALVDAKRRGVAPKAPARAGKVIDLQAALRASVARAHAGRPARRKRAAS